MPQPGTVNLRTLLGILALALLLPSCGDDREVLGPCPDCPFLVVEGEVRGPDGPVAAKVLAEQVTERVGAGNRLTAATDAEGRYRLLIPPGRYVFSARGYEDGQVSRIYAWSEGRATAWGARLDTLTMAVGDEIRKMDFILGGIRLNVSSTDPDSRLFAEVGVVPVAAPEFATKTRLRSQTGVAVAELPNLAPGEYYMWIRSGYGPERYWFPASMLPGDAVPIRVSMMRNALLTTTVSEPGLLHGAITGSWMTIDPTLPFEVSLFSATDSTSRIASQWLFSSSRYEFVITAPLAARVQVEFDGAKRWIGGRRFADATTFDVGPGRSVEDADFVESGLHVQVDLPRVPKGERISARWILVDERKRVLREGGWSFTVGSPFPVSMLSPGTYYLYAGPGVLGRNPWIGEWFDGSRLPADATPITIAEDGETVSVVFHPASGGDLPLRILHADGRLAQISHLDLVEMSDPSKFLPAVAARDSTERYTVHGLRSGNWKVGWRGRTNGQLIYSWYPGTPDVNEAIAVPVVEGEEAPVLEWRLP